MCGRYALFINRQRLRQAVGALVPEGYAPHYNIGPGRSVLALRATDRAEPQLEAFHWGLKTPRNFLINARLETADQLSRFRDSWRHRRCLVPANGYFEWQREGAAKQPWFLFPPDDGEPIRAFAGLYFSPAETGLEQACCVLLTTEATGIAATVHHRMPVPIPAEKRQAWLSGELQRPDLAAEAETAVWRAHPVSPRVNAVRNDDSTLIDRVDPPRDDQLQLF